VSGAGRVEGRGSGGFQPAGQDAALLAVVRDPQRVAAVRRLVPLYRPPSPVFDRLTGLAAQLLTAPVALLTLVEADRQFFVSSYGLEEPVRSARQTPVEYSICQYAVASARPLLVPDATQDRALADHPAVTELGVVAYVGIPLVTPSGWTVGTLCVIDFCPRYWTDAEVATLDMLAGICMDEIRLVGYDRLAELDKQWDARHERRRRDLR
jgi:GAF domain-containing protein